MGRSSELATCAAGHPSAERAVSVFAARTREGNGAVTVAHCLSNLLLSSIDLQRLRNSSEPKAAV